MEIAQTCVYGSNLDTLPGSSSVEVDWSLFYYLNKNCKVCFDSIKNGSIKYLDI